MPNRRKTTQQKDLEGTGRADRANPREPRYPAKAPPMPEWLCPEAAKVWRVLVAEMTTAQTITPVYAGVLADFCELDADIADMSRRLKKGEKFDDPEKRKYAIRQERRAAITVRRLLANDLGLTPTALAKVSQIGSGESTGDNIDAPPPQQPRRPRVQAEASKVN